ncbi:MAG TPA: L-lactate permease [Chthoniobacteraceae bacterium]|jgi:lactate permease|nr:L-lactate permease [Chthoniobacteraceae bacterium]
MAIWSQSYDPCGNIFLSASIAAIPAILLLSLVAGLNVRIHIAACAALAACLAIAIGFYHMPSAYAAASTVYGAGYGLFPIGWLVLNIIFVYQLTVKRGLFDVLRRSLAQVAPDPRVQIILIAFAFGAFLEGMSGFGAPVAITAAILIQLGFRPLHASGLALVANTAPVAFGSLGIPLTTLQQVTDLDIHALSATTGALLAPFSFGIPFLIVIMFAGWRGLAGIWPAALVAGLSYTIPQWILATWHGPWLAAPVAGLSCIASLVILLRFWRPRELLGFNSEGRLLPVAESALAAESPDSPRRIFYAWLPWAILTALILIWGVPQVQNALDRIFSADLDMPYLHNLVRRMPPVVLTHATPIKAVFTLHVLSATGTGIFVGSILIGLVIGYSPFEWMATYLETLWHIRFSLLTIAAMLAFGNVTRYSGADGTMGLALAHSGRLYPFFGTLLGWIGAAITGSDTSTNVLFGSLQKITAQQIGISASLMCAANTCGGVMGKMISSQSIVVASTATNWYGHEGRILRYVFLTSLILAAIMGVLVCFAAYAVPLLTK